MNFKHLAIATLLVLIAVFSFLALQPKVMVSDTTAILPAELETVTIAPIKNSDTTPVNNSLNNQATVNDGPVPIETSAGVNARTSKLEAFGKVVDENNQPLEQVLISDELSFGSVRSDAAGNYQIWIGQHAYKTPILNFLRSGYQEKRVGIAIDNSPPQSRFEINVRLEAATNTTNVLGWLGNEQGEGLADRKITIRAQPGQGSGNIYYAVISDDSGEFSFEGIRADVIYKMVIDPSEHYAGYTVEPFRVSKNTPPITILLDNLRLVDVEGLIVGTDDSPVANFGINVQNLSLDYPDRRITSDSSGFFKLRRFPVGELKLSTNAPEYFKITGLRIRENEYRNLNLAIDKGSYLLSGWVSDKFGAPLAEVRVTLDSEFSTDRYLSSSQRSMVTDSSGRFQFSDLGGIDHIITVYAGGYDIYSERHRFSSFSDTLEIRLSQ